MTVLEKFDLRVAETIQRMGCAIIQVEGWQERIAQRLPGDEVVANPVFMVGRAVNRLIETGVVKTTQWRVVRVGDVWLRQTDELLENMCDDGPIERPVLTMDVPRLERIMSAMADDSTEKSHSDHSAYFAKG